MKNNFLSVFIFMSVCSSFAQTIQLASVSSDVFCSTGKDTMRFSLNYTNIPQNSNIVFYQSTNPAFNPYAGQGDSIGFINVGANTSGGGGQVTTTCPEILGIFIDACDQGGTLREVDNEYMVITSGNVGFNVSDLKIQLPNTSINVSGCPFQTPSAATMTQLRNGTCDGTTLLAAGQSDFIPANAIVIIFTGRGPLYNYNFSSYCSSGQPIYILQNSCSPGTANFVNNAPSACSGGPTYRTTSITVLGCNDRLTYAPCTLPPFNAGNPNADDGNYVIHLPNTDTSSITNGGIRNNAADKCNGLRFDSISGATIIKYPIPNDGGANPATNFCNTGYHYIKAITHPNGSQPVSNAVQFKLVCIDLTATTPNGTICSGQNAVVNNSSTDANATLTWTVSGGASITRESAGSGNQINQTLTNTSLVKDSVLYTITAADATCSINKQVKVVVNPAPVPFNLGNDTAYCGPFTRTLSTGNPTTVWSTGFTGTQITVNSGGTYKATITGPCGTVTDSIIITQNNTQPPINLGNDTSYCGSFSRVLSTGNAATVWTNNIGNPTVTASQITVTQPGTYTATITSACGNATDAITISQSPGIAFDFGAPSTTVCTGGNITLDASTAYDSYLWNTGAITHDILITLPGKYWVDVFKNGCKGSDTILVTEISKETKPNLGPDISLCSPFSQPLSTGKANTTWYLNNGQINIGASINATQFGTYIAKVSNSCGDVSDTIVITQTNSQPPINLGNDTSFCGSFSYLLSTGNPATVWTNNVGVPSVTASQITVTQAGTYTATITGGCGNASDAITINQSAGITFDFGSPTTTVCAGGNITLDASTAYDSYLWNTGAVTHDILITQPGKYWVDVFKNGCKGSDTIQAIEINQPVKPVLGADTSFCGQFSKVLSNGSVPADWLRNGAFIITSTSITATQTGTYIAKVSNSCGSVADTIVISGANAFNVNLGRDTIICDGKTLTINASTPGINISYNWNTGEQTPTITVNQFGQYIVDVSNGNCTVSDTILVDVLDLPVIASLGNDTFFCGNFSFPLFTGDAGTIWSTGATGPLIDITQGGTYIAENKNVCGSAKDTIVIRQFALPAVNLGRDTTVCDSIVLNVGNGNFTSILWNTGDTTKSIVAASSAVFSVKVTNANCTNADSVRINKECFYEVYLPTAFSPNGDNINDVLVPLSPVVGMKVLEFAVFNRWGEKVFESKDFVPGDVSNGWKGTYKGENCQVDHYVYYFTVKMPDDKVKTYKGTFALLR
ncbi:MAG TPA: gliding motility-associated C-terminal domain-containing protein [Chitinophagales bacterium]|nr:gliding motility-associated C-terminal domain-containing protein [Chitinophagales bacterium]